MTVILIWSNRVVESPCDSLHVPESLINSNSLMICQLYLFVFIYLFITFSHQSLPAIKHAGLAGSFHPVRVLLPYKGLSSLLSCIPRVQIDAI